MALPHHASPCRRFPAGNGPRRSLLLLLPFLCCAAGAIAQDAPEARFAEPAESHVTVPEGHLTLRWEVTDHAGDAEGWEFQLEQSFNEAFAPTRAVYTGPDFGSFVSGLPGEGAWLRVRARPSGATEWGPWSPVLRVEVDYPPSWQVAVLGSAGLAMFAILLGSIVVGARRTLPSSSSAT